MKCPSCAAAVLVADIRHLPCIYRRESMLIAEVEGRFCPACGECVLGPVEAGRVSAALLAFHRKVDGSTTGRE
ncbi:type II toxin-antitoxin system MqsA family antitoxin [Variovorax saccharolyticus]|uniref:type II toxin-antitoxin system MqsA family antitoxin n=1 Tax=Variovorax saccharolyticus TaxID=3053516 RepID=UPI00257725BF|nr:type II toxin-antitoxin system MqsA family antitoxin [Variovorax sp. J31P216]MDM0024637.1 type II toxin-antitoxin system MqsA family antitoxin [Variovorax sp. J31P216]